VNDRELHGDVFKGTGANDLGVMSDGEGGLRLTVIAPHGMGVRAHLPRERAVEAWLRMAELIHADDKTRLRGL
jgi:hypothetical protein